MPMKWIDGGATAPAGFSAAGVACGIKKNGRPDLALLVTERPAVWAGVFTSNQVKGHSLLYTMNLAGRPARGVLINSGNANACLGARGDEDTLEMARLAAEALGFAPDEILLSSTGVIGQPMNLKALAEGVRAAAAELSPAGGGAAAQAIMTTDTFPKEAAVELDLNGRTIRIGGMAKGSGMIHPNMATLLAFVTTDAAVAPDALRTALQQAVEESFNSITVDGDTSPDDALVVLANGAAGGGEIRLDSSVFAEFCRGLAEVCRALAVMIAKDGEGATKLVAIKVSGARSAAEAREVGRTIGRSCLVKTAVFGADANWGRILTAVGYAPVRIDPAAVEIRIGGVLVCKDGAGVEFSEEEAKAALVQNELEIEVRLGLGEAAATVWTCDLTYDYIKINGSYRS